MENIIITRLVTGRVVCEHREDGIMVASSSGTTLSEALEALALVIADMERRS